jgi:hypothetical protein
LMEPWILMHCMRPCQRSTQNLYRKFGFHSETSKSSDGLASRRPLYESFLINIFSFQRTYGQPGKHLEHIMGSPLSSEEVRECQCQGWNWKWCSDATSASGISLLMIQPRTVITWQRLQIARCPSCQVALILCVCCSLVPFYGNQVKMLAQWPRVYHHS